MSRPPPEPLRCRSRPAPPDAPADFEEAMMITLLDGHPGRRPGGDDEEDWLALIALAALTLAALLALRRRTGREPR